MKTCEVCGHDHQALDNVEYDCDYEPCGYCGWDHAYEPTQASAWHIAHPGPDGGYDDGVQDTVERE